MREGKYNKRRGAGSLKERATSKQPRSPKPMREQKEIEMHNLAHSAGLPESTGRLQPARRETGTSQGEQAVLIRAVFPGDEEKLRAMFSRLSLETVYRRFHSPYPKVPEWTIALFTKVDCYRRGAAAVVGNEIVGHAMYVRLGDSNEAEFSIIVEDEWQSKGVGKLLLSELAEEARRQGIQTFTGIVLRENRRMLGLIDSVFTGARRILRDGLYDVLAPLTSLEPVTILESRARPASVGESAALLSFGSTNAPQAQ